MQVRAGAHGFDSARLTYRRRCGHFAIAERPAVYGSDEEQVPLAPPLEVLIVCGLSADLAQHVGHGLPLAQRMNGAQIGLPGTLRHCLAKPQVPVSAVGLAEFVGVPDAGGTIALNCRDNLERKNVLAAPGSDKGNMETVPVELSANGLLDDGGHAGAPRTGWRGAEFVPSGSSSPVSSYSGRGAPAETPAVFAAWSRRAVSRIRSPPAHTTWWCRLR